MCSHLAHSTFFCVDCASQLVAIEDKLDGVPLHATTAGLSRVDGIVTSTLDNKLIDNVMTALVGALA